MSNENNESSHITGFMSIGQGDDAVDEIPANVFQQKDFTTRTYHESFNPNQIETEEKEKEEKEIIIQTPEQKAQEEYNEFKNAIPSTDLFDRRDHLKEIMEFITKFGSAARDHVAKIKEEGQQYPKEKCFYNHASLEDYLENKNTRKFCRMMRERVPDLQSIIDFLVLYDGAESKYQTKLRLEEEERKRILKEEQERARRQAEMEMAEEKLARHFSVSYQNELRRLHRENEYQESQRKKQVI